MKCLPSADRTARDLIEPASDPLLGSVKQNAANTLPWSVTIGKYFFFCSGVPNNKIPCEEMVGNSEKKRQFQLLS